MELELWRNWWSLNDGGIGGAFPCIN